MIYQYDELTYAKLIYDNGFQTQAIRRELLILVKYLKTLNLQKAEIEKYVYNFCQKYIEKFNEIKYYKIIDKAIRDGCKKNSFLLVLDGVDITKSELEYFNSLEIEHQYKKLLFTMMVYKKIKYEVNKLHKKNTSEEVKISIYLEGDAKVYREIFKKSNIVGKYDINIMINKLVEEGLIESMYNGNLLLKYMDNIPHNENEEVFYRLIPKDFNNIGYIFDYYTKQNKIKVCENEGCGTLVQAKSNRTKYCKDCWKEEQLKWQRESMRKLRQQKKCEVLEKP